MCVFTHSSSRSGLQVPTRGPGWFLEADVSISPAHSERWSMCLVPTASATARTSPRVFGPCSQPGQLPSVMSNSM